MRTLFVTFVVVMVLAAALPALALEHATEGIITRVDSTAKKIAVKTADGTEEVFHFTEQTAMHAAKGAKTGAVDSYLAGKEGTHVVVRYTGEGADKTATSVDDFGKNTVKVSKGTITKFDKAARTLTVKAEDGSEQTYHVAKDATIDTAHGVVKSTEYNAKRGENASVHYTEKAGHKVVHFIKGL
jgi:hypothetical protein